MLPLPPISVESGRPGTRPGGGARRFRRFLAGAWAASQSSALGVAVQASPSSSAQFTASSWVPMVNAEASVARNRDVVLAVFEGGQPKMATGLTGHPGSLKR